MTQAFILMFLTILDLIRFSVVDQSILIGVDIFTGVGQLFGV